MSAGKERPGASGREICGSRQKQTAKMGQLARRARLARTGACRSMSQLGNAASDWKKENRADFFPSDLLGQAAKGGLFIPKPQLVTEVISDVVRESVRELCACYARCSIESLTDRPHQAPLSVASLTILEMLRGRRFQVLASHRLPPVRIYHDHTHTHTTDDQLATAPGESRGLCCSWSGEEQPALSLHSASHCYSCPDETRNQSSRGD